MGLILYNLRDSDLAVMRMERMRACDATGSPGPSQQKCQRQRHAVPAVQQRLGVPQTASGQLPSRFRLLLSADPGEGTVRGAAVLQPRHQPHHAGAGIHGAAIRSRSLPARPAPAFCPSSTALYLVLPAFLHWRVVSRHAALANRAHQWHHSAVSVCQVPLCPPLHHKALLSSVALNYVCINVEPISKRGVQPVLPL
jgi:hypothetical protein